LRREAVYLFLVDLKIPGLEMTIVTVLHLVHEIALYFRTPAVSRRLVE
jgi:hypothetical protein